MTDTHPDEHTSAPVARWWHRHRNRWRPPAAPVAPCDNGPACGMRTVRIRAVDAAGEPVL